MLSFSVLLLLADLLIAERSSCTLGLPLRVNLLAQQVEELVQPFFPGGCLFIFRCLQLEVPSGFALLPGSVILIELEKSSLEISAAMKSGSTSSSISAVPCLTNMLLSAICGCHPFQNSLVVRNRTFSFALCLHDDKIIKINQINAIGRTAVDCFSQDIWIFPALRVCPCALCLRLHEERVGSYVRTPCAPNTLGLLYKHVRSLLQLLFIVVKVDLKMGRGLGSLFGELFLCFGRVRLLDHLQI
mmetsp:Transcript_118687/g.221848  ORF Transcript_118687/g.221848 Transcript_118687/m.221848 type:complete len:244 (-) Transcript_118687:1043-1774(-)